MRCSVYIVCPSVLSCSSHKLHETLEAKNTLNQEKIMRSIHRRVHEARSHRSSTSGRSKYRLSSGTNCLCLSALEHQDDIWHFPNLITNACMEGTTGACYNASNISTPTWPVSTRHVTEYAQLKLGNIPVTLSSFKSRVLRIYLKENKRNILHMTLKICWNSCPCWNSVCSSKLTVFLKTGEVANSIGLN